MNTLIMLLSACILMANSSALANTEYYDPIEGEAPEVSDYPKYFASRNHPSHSQETVATYTGFTCDDTSWSAQGAEFLIEGSAEFYVSVLPGVMFGSKRTCKVSSVRQEGAKKYVKIRGDEDCSLTVRYPRTTQPKQEPKMVVYVFVKGEC